MRLLLRISSDFSYIQVKYNLYCFIGYPQKNPKVKSKIKNEKKSLSGIPEKGLYQ
jgi:hypothetical protein